MALHAPATDPGRARASSALFALAACAAFVLAIHDTASGRAPELDVGAPAPLGAAAADAIERDGVPVAAELAEAEAAEAEAAEAIAAFDSAAAARAGDPEVRARALRSLLDPHAGPASWIALSEASTADRLAALERLGVRVTAEGGKALQRVVIAPEGRAGCAELERAAISTWGAGHAGTRGRSWIPPDGGYRAALRAEGRCELRIERCAPLEPMSRCAERSE